MSEAMWFLFGFLCGGTVVFFGLPKKKPAIDRKITTQKPTKTWGETHNFLYYDGTVMPEIKEDLHEQ